MRWCRRRTGGPAGVGVRRDGGRPAGALALAALEVDSLSVAVNQLTAARRAMADLPADGLNDLAPQLLRLRSADEARALLRQWLRQRAGLVSADCVRTGDGCCRERPPWRSGLTRGRH